MIKIRCPDGATPLDDYSGLIPRWVITIQDLNSVEAENISIAQKKYLHKKNKQISLWFTIPTLKKIHATMFNQVWKWAGHFRKSVTSIGIAPHLIPMRLGELCHRVASWEHDDTNTLSVIEKAAIIHHQLVFIHPFENGNGRFSRLVSDKFLLSMGWQHPHWPSQLQDNGETRNDYIKSLKDADKGHYEPLIELMQNLGACKKQ